MAQKTLDMVIVLGGRVDNTFTALGDNLIQLGAQANQISQVLINVGKESVDVYENYEKEMASAKVALSTTYTNAAELEKVMSDLNVAASGWAKNSIFHTNDVAHAISEAAHAGLDYEQMLDMLPAAMELAQAGNMDLSTAFSMLNDSLLAMGADYSFARTFADQWTFAANSVNTDVESMGEAMTRMSATLMFGGDSAEVLTMLGILAERGVKGSAAGTLLRNSMIRLVAPTATAQKALDKLGISSEDVSEAFEETGVTAEEMAAITADLAKYGFSAYDKSGNLKDWVDIWNSLHVTLSSMFGEDYMQNEDALGLMSKIFPTRTITGAMALLTGFGGGAANALYEGILSGSEGYGAYAAQIMNDTLFGNTELFKSKWENLESLIGQYLKSPLEEVQDALGVIIDNVAELPEEEFSGIAGALTVMAAAGPGIIGLGLALKLLGFIMSPASAVMMGIVGATAAIVGFNEAMKVDYSKEFGSMKVDTETIGGYIKELGNSYDAAYAQVHAYNKALEQSVTDYTNASSTFSSRLLTAMLTDAVLEPTEIEQLKGLGKELQGYVQDGIDEGFATTMSFWEVLFGDESSGTLNDMSSALQTEWLSLKAQAQRIGQEINKSLTDAIANDGKIDKDEYDKIVAYLREYNSMMSEAARQVANEEMQTQFEIMLHKSQTASIDDINAMAEQAMAERDKRLKDLEDQYEYARAQQVVIYRNQGKSEAEIEDILKYGIDGKGGEELGADEEYRKYRDEINSTYGIFLARMYGDTFKNSDLYDFAGNAMQSIIDGVANNPDLTPFYYYTKLDTKQRKNLKTFYDTLYESGIYGMSKDELAAAGLGDYYDMFSTIRYLAKITDKVKLGSVNDYTSWYAAREDRDEVLYGAASEALSQIIKPQSIGDYVDTIKVIHDSYQQAADENPVNIIVQPIPADGFSGSIEGDNGGINSLFERKAFGYYAKGGRADTPSIFGEAGAEWAIPEQHTAETARLLLAAAAASGFSWGELPAASGESGAYTLIYSPTIYAQDANGVEEKLIADKARLKKYLAERQMREKAEVYS